MSLTWTVWSRCRRGRAVGVEAWLLSDEDLLVHLCFHILHQGAGTPLLWWYELDLLIRRTQATLNWDAAIAIAEQAGPFFVVEVLRTLRDRFVTPVPQSVLARLASRASVAPVTSLLVNAPRLAGREEFAQFVSLPGFRARARYALGLLFPSPTYMLHRYGARDPVRLVVAYAIRFIRLSLEGLRWAVLLLVAAFFARPSPSR